MIVTVQKQSIPANTTTGFFLENETANTQRLLMRVLENGEPDAETTQATVQVSDSGASSFDRFNLPPGVLLEIDYNPGANIQIQNPNPDPVAVDFMIIG